MISKKYKHSLSNTSDDNQSEDKALNQHLEIKCTLIGGLLPMFDIKYQNRLISGLFSRTIWDDKVAIIRMAETVLEERHKVEPFNTSEI